MTYIFDLFHILNKSDDNNNDNENNYNNKDNNNNNNNINKNNNTNNFMSKTEKSHLWVRSWLLLTILNFSTRRPTYPTVF